MKKVTRTPKHKKTQESIEKNSQGYLATKMVVGLIGVTLSLVLHELFHVVMHWGQVRRLDFFPNPWTVVEVNTAIPPGYDLEGEEIVAYGITLLVILITTIVIFKMRDSEDKRTPEQILFPKDKKMQKFSSTRLLGLSEDERQSTLASKSHKKI